MPYSITAAVAAAAQAPLTMTPAQLRDIGPGEILVEMKAVGVCHTDLAARDGFFGLPTPMVLGHEGAGVVLETGPGVTSVTPGDHVAISFASCGDCRQCLAHNPSYCAEFAARNYGDGRDGRGRTSITADGKDLTGDFFGQSSFATKAITAARNVVKVDADLPWEVVAPMGCGLQTGAGAVLNSFDCPAGASLLVLGSGPVGLAAVMAAKHRGLSQIIVVEPHAGRRELATELGASVALDPAAGALDEQVRSVAPDGVDFAFDTTGIAALVQQAVGLIAPLGTLGFVGVPSDLAATITVPIVPAMVTGLTVRGITEGDSDIATFIPFLLNLYRDGAFPVDRLVTTYPFADVNGALDDQAQGSATKVVLTF